MFLRNLRNLKLRRAFPTRAFATRATTSSSSSSSAASREYDNDDLIRDASEEDILEMVADLAEKQSHDALGLEGLRGRSITGNVYKSFRANEAGSFVRPWDFSLKERTVAPPKRIRKPYLGPSRKASEREDLFRQLDLDPVAFALNPLLLGKFITQMGMIKGRKETFLTRRSQRRLAQAIKRSRMIGVLPVHNRSQW